MNNLLETQRQTEEIKRNFQNYMLRTKAQKSSNNQMNTHQIPSKRLTLENQNAPNIVKLTIAPRPQIKIEKVTSNKIHGQVSNENPFLSNNDKYFQQNNVPFDVFGQKIMENINDFKKNNNNLNAKQKDNISMTSDSARKLLDFDFDTYKKDKELYHAGFKLIHNDELNNYEKLNESILRTSIGNKNNQIEKKEGEKILEEKIEEDDDKKKEDIVVENEGKFKRIGKKLLLFILLGLLTLFGFYFGWMKYFRKKITLEKQ